MEKIKKKFIPITQINDWDKIGGDSALKKHCEHIVSHAERYMPERVFESKVLLDNFKK